MFLRSQHRIHSQPEHRYLINILAWSFSSKCMLPYPTEQIQVVDGRCLNRVLSAEWSIKQFLIVFGTSPSLRHWCLVGSLISSSCVSTQQRAVCFLPLLMRALIPPQVIHSHLLSTFQSHTLRCHHVGIGASVYEFKGEKRQNIQLSAFSLPTNGTDWVDVLPGRI